MFHDIYSLANSFGTTFGLSADVERIDGSLHHHKLTLKPKEHSDITEDEAKEIFELVTKAFSIGGRFEHEFNGFTYEFDKESLTIIEHRKRWDE